MDQPKIAGTSPIPIEMEAGKKYAWCTCGLSVNQPLCDGSHKGTEFRPMIVEGEAGKEVYFCTCKQTCNQPACDGTHNSLGGDPPADPA